MFSSRLRQAAAALTLTCCLALPSCVIGPRQLVRTVDDWDQELYVQSPWMDGVLNTIVPIVPLARLGAGLIDFFVGNPMAFWLEDAWDSKGTGYIHFNPEHTDGAVKSLLLKDGSFGTVHR